MKREDLHLRVLRVKVTGGDNLEGYRPVTDAEAFRLLLFDVCENPGCDMGQIWPLGEDSRPGDSYDCSACGGSGQTPKDGVRGAWVQLGLASCLYLTSDPDEIEVYVVPASMLDPEGDTRIANPSTPMNA